MSVRKGHITRMLAVGSSIGVGVEVHGKVDDEDVVLAVVVQASQAEGFASTLHQAQVQARFEKAINDTLVARHLPQHEVAAVLSQVRDLLDLP